MVLYSLSAVDHLQLESLGQQDPLRQSPNPRINRTALLFPRLTHPPQIRQLDRKNLNKLALLQLRLQVFILGQVHINADVHHLQIRVAKPRVVKHHGRRLSGHADVACLLAEFADGAFFGCFALIDQTGWDFDCHGVDGRAVLFLEDEFGACGEGQDGYYADAVDVGGLGTCQTFG